ncbi:probable LRR receptor-like serine/threonine-protein kinase At1g53420 isoform X3 [Prunus persica]|uniref:probable LRR receptor-like serine/threonine-protein kinase At1g53420 isoform X3 n=1 Tax=Prunus persica TaxID=3760 RepID=UPI0009AB3562|nr:probable LRR receptor-like serine/threonine-protein kinase At1g53420 isoform X3 [Prunus persica]
MVETRPRLLVEHMLLSFLLWQFGFRHGSSETTTELDPKEVVVLNLILDKLRYSGPSYSNSSICHYGDLETIKLKINCTEDCGHDKNSYCHIKDFSFTGAALTGFIPEEVEELKHLETLDLSGNQLTGSIPDTLWNLSSLIQLDLSMNQLNGGISKRIESLRNLTILDLSGNQLTGSIPDTLWNLSSLIALDLSRNQLTGGISEHIQFLRNLTALYLGYNFLSGQIPSSLGALRSLQTLSLSYNELSGPIPYQLGNITALQTFWAASNDLTGEFPDYATLTQMNVFSISGNYMSGPFPADFIRNWTLISHLSILGNNFEGSLPAELFSFSSLDYLTISDVANSGFQFPRTANLSNIETLILRNCSITGEIPEYIGKMSNLEYLDLSFNILTGRIPQSMSGLNLTHLSLAKNKLNDTIPAWLVAVKTRLDLSYNSFSKVSFGVPDDMRDHLNLFACCRSSSLTDPDQLFVDPKKRMPTHCPRRKSKSRSLFINCGGEGLTVGDKYYEADNSTSLYYISPSKTWGYSLSGDLSPESNSSNFIQTQSCGIHVAESDLYLKARIAPLFLSYYAFCLQKGKYNVTLHFAEIVFKEKESYSILKRRVFDVYIQENRVLMNFDIAKEAKGPDEPQTKYFIADVSDSVLEISFYWAGKGCADDPPTLNGPLISAISITPVPQRSALWRKLKKALIITLPSSVVVLLLLLAFMWKIGWLGKRELSEIQIGQDKHVTLQELIGATRKFSSKMEIGRGHFGRVYKAELEGGQTTVAVKRLSTNSKEKVEELLNEFYALKSLRHENLVQLLDAYFGEGLHLLIYEYMPNLSIADAFFGSKSRLKFNWENRFNICLGIARGLDHLHEHPRLKMVHRDIKAENILLDGALNAKISDFGMASLYTEEEQLMIIKVEAPNGHMAPEYVVQGFVTSKVDVYSFGVLILEIVSGKKNAGYKFNHESEYLLDMAYVAYKNGSLVDLVDKNLSGNYDAKQAITILTLAVMCTNISPTLRPRMADVVSILVGEKTFEQINRPTVDDHQLNVAMAHGECTKADSSTSTDVSARASTSTKLIKGIEETEIHYAEPDLEILEESQTSFSG